MGYAGLMMQIAGMANSAAGSYYGAKVQRTNLQTQAYLADVNARLAEMSAQSVLDQGQKRVGQLTMQAGRIKGSQRAALAANGVDLGDGSAAEVLASTDLMKEIDRNTLELDAIRTAWGYRTQGANYQNEGLMARAGAQGISPAGAAFSSLLGSSGQVASNWYTLDKAGALDGTWMASSYWK